MSMEKRIDIALVECGLCKSRARAKNLLKEGSVLLNGTPCTKPSVLVTENDKLSLSGSDIPFVGRGGLKLQEALSSFSLSVTNRVCMDIGASTGGFTDCMLQNGASKVYAIDVGHDQLDVSLRTNNKVVNLEGMDVRRMQREDFDEIPDFCSVDVSFISLNLVLPSIFQLTGECADYVVLVKPQFEAGKSSIGKKGIVKSASVHVQVLENVLSFARNVGFTVHGLCLSPIRGGSGNVEYLAHLKKGCAESEFQPDLQMIVKQAGLGR